MERAERAGGAVVAGCQCGSGDAEERSHGSDAGDAERGAAVVRNVAVAVWASRRRRRRLGAERAAARP